MRVTRRYNFAASAISKYGLKVSKSGIEGGGRSTFEKEQSYPDNHCLKNNVQIFSDHYQLQVVTRLVSNQFH